MSSSLPRLCLHLDVNETMILSDAAGGDTFDESLHKIIAKQAMICGCTEETKLSESELLDQCKWSDGRSLRSTMFSSTNGQSPQLNCDWNLPEGWTRFYRVEALKESYAKKFCEEGSPGSCFASIRREAEKRMRWKEDEIEAKHNDLRRGPYRYILPGIWRLIEHLVTARRRVTLIIRTFGSDLDEIGSAFKAFADHKDEPLFARLADLIKDEYSYKLHRTDTSLTLIRKDGLELDESQALEEIERDTDQLRCIGISDDYPFWKSRNYDPSAGKPLWLGHVSARHIFFDDNIHNNPIDSIIAIRLRTPEATFRSLDGFSTLRLHNFALVRVPTIQAILDPNWFLHRLAECESNIHQIMSSSSSFTDDAPRQQHDEISFFRQQNWIWLNRLLQDIHRFSGLNR